MRQEKEYGHDKPDTAEKKRMRRIYEVKTPEILDDSFSKGKPKVNPHKVLIRENQKTWLKKRN